MAARVLVIEDNPANLELMTYLLTAFGHATLQALDGAEGLALAGREVPDLVVCDVQLPDIDGYEVARRLKADAKLRNVPLVAVTALAMVGDRRKVMDAGFDGYIAKPIDPETFVSELEVFLRPEQRSTQPAVRAEAVSTALHVSPRPPSTGEIILVVDDLPSNIDLVRSILEASGYRVVSAVNVDEATALAQKVGPALIISDVNMPGKSGFEFLQTVKAAPELSRIAWVFLASTPCTASERQAALALGADRFILRPVEPEVLLEEIEACLREERRR
jgi:two-component system cell cycle response regulator